MISRTVRVIESSESETRNELGSFFDYLTVPNIILLGDPGAGKTHIFKVAAKEEEVEFRSVRDFLVFAESEVLQKTVYLDGLDEFRSRIKDKHLINELVKLLSKQGRPNIRLSCRSVDWLGESDLVLFKRLFGATPYVVLNLEPLTTEEIFSVLQTKNFPDPETFINKARSLNLEGFLKNPQTLIMLANVVQQGIWPDTRKELFEKSCNILLTEHNREHKGSGHGQFNRDELLEPAGEVAAALLISGVAGISLLEDVESGEFPSYKTIDFKQKEMIQACLMRRVFSFVDSKNEAVSYIHRTIVEFLAARWLATRIRAGHSILRINSLIGIEGYPASELRGLHAWIPVFSPEHSEIFINQDPYGVLMYGDAASLSLSNRKTLLSALITLSQTDPWFRTDDWSDEPMGLLSGTDMVASFQKILSDRSSSFHLRSVVLGAIANGPQLPLIRDDLKRIVSDRDASYHEHLMAVKALLRVVPDGQQDLINIFKTKLNSDATTARLRSLILAQIYGIQFDPVDIFSIFQDILQDTEKHSVGELWGLVSSLPATALPEILDSLSTLNVDNIVEKWDNVYAVESAFTQLLLRVLQSDFTPQVEQLWLWLKTLYFLGNRHRASDEITAWLKRHQDLVFEMLLFVYNENKQEVNWSLWYEFARVTMHSLVGKNLVKRIFELLKLKTNLSEADCLFYQISGIQFFSTEPHTARYLLEDFLALAKKYPQLESTCRQICRYEIEDWRIEDCKSNFERKHEQEVQREQNKVNLEKTRESIVAGRHLHNLAFLAKIYLGTSDPDKTLSPIERLRKIIGDDLIAPALNGFIAVLERKDLPTPYDVSLSLAENSYWPWWYAILAGMNEAWQQQGKSLKQFSDNLLKIALAVAIELPYFDENDSKWHVQLLQERPDIVEFVYEELATVGLKHKKSHIPVLYYLEHNEESKQWRSKVSLKLLWNFHCTSHGYLKTLVLAGLYDPSYHNELQQLAKHGVVSCFGEQRAIWLIVGFLLNNEKLTKLLDVYSKNRDWVIWILRDISLCAKEKITDKPFRLSIEQMESCIIFAGRAFANISMPSEMSGNQHPWDAAKFVCDTINTLAVVPDRESTFALKRLLQNEQISSYHDNLKHALAKQANVRREAEYRQPSWIETIEALKNGKPASIVDLHALFFDQLQIEKQEINLSSTDPYKSFWRCDSDGKVNTPEVENICRDRLIDRLKPSLSALDLHVIREGNMAEDKRADILVLGSGGMKLPLELKRDFHEDLWISCKDQLERMYARDPDAAGYGIYVVFWFGERRRTKMKCPPNGIQKPNSAVELENALRSLVPSEQTNFIKVVVLDVTPPY